MVKKVGVIFTLFAFVLLLVDCAMTTSIGQGGLGVERVTGKLYSKVFPEIQLVTAKGESYTGKIMELEEDTITLRPSPYWNVELVKIPIEEIYFIKFPKSGAKVLFGFLNGLGWGFLVPGFLSAVTSKYNTDFEAGLQLGAGAGLLGGLVGLLVGGIITVASKSKYEFSGWSGNDKRLFIREIMGL